MREGPDDSATASGALLVSGAAGDGFEFLSVLLPPSVFSSLGLTADALVNGAAVAPGVSGPALLAVAGD